MSNRHVALHLRFMLSFFRQSYLDWLPVFNENGSLIFDISGQTRAENVSIDCQLGQLTDENWSETMFRMNRKMPFAMAPHECKPWSCQGAA